MKIETIKKFVKYADDNNLSYIVTADNEHHYFGNCNGLEIIWDDANEVMIQLTTNQEPGIKSKGIAMEAYICGYDNIQHCRILLDKVDAIKFYNEFIDPSTAIDQKTKDNVKEYVRLIASNINYPTPVTGNGSR